MSESSNLKNELTSVLHSAAKVLNLEDYEINLNLDTILGDGFLGEFYKVSLTDNVAKKEIKLALKKAPESEKKRKENSIEFCYKNEIYFYSTIYPALQQFEKKHGVENCFKSVPQYITSESCLGKEIIALKDLTTDGFQLREKTLLLDDEHARFIFETYGHFHATSFCFKKQEPKEFEALVKPLTRIWNQMDKTEGFKFFLGQVLKKAYKALSVDEDALVREKFERYVSNYIQIFEDATFYNGKYSGLLHGDCWSNNMMFKYKDHQNQKNVVDINLLDFQLVATGTPVFDLSYFFYTGGSKILFDNLEQYLDIYYKSFKEAASNLGERAEDLFPREMLSQDWKQYSKFGMMLALMLTQIKLISKNDSVEMIKHMDKKTSKQEDFEIKVDETLFNQRAADIIRHVYEIDAL